MSEVGFAVTWQQLGLVGMSVALVWKVLDVGTKMFLSKLGVAPTLPATACQTDPVYPQRLKEVHRWMREQHENINRGDLNCQWKDRDEVRDMIDMMRQLVEATKENARESRVLSSELRKTRNGYHDSS